MDYKQGCRSLDKASDCIRLSHYPTGCSVTPSRQLHRAGVLRHHDILVSVSLTRSAASRSPTSAWRGTTGHVFLGLRGTTMVLFKTTRRLRRHWCTSSVRTHSGGGRGRGGVLNLAAHAHDGISSTAPRLQPGLHHQMRCIQGEHRCCASPGAWSDRILQQAAHRLPHIAHNV
jgi:hypothetical protein